MSASRACRSMMAWSMWRSALAEGACRMRRNSRIRCSGNQCTGCVPQPMVRSAFSVSQRSSSATDTSRSRPSRTSRIDGCTHRSKLSRLIPSEAAASSRVSAVRGTGAVSAIDFSGVEGGSQAADQTGVAAAWRAPAGPYRAVPTATGMSDARFTGSGRFLLQRTCACAGGNTNTCVNP